MNGAGAGVSEQRAQRRGQRGAGGEGAPGAGGDHGTQRRARALLPQRWHFARELVELEGGDWRSALRILGQAALHITATCTSSPECSGCGPYRCVSLLCARPPHRHAFEKWRMESCKVSRRCAEGFRIVPASVLWSPYTSPGRWEGSPQFQRPYPAVPRMQVDELTAAAQEAEAASVYEDEYIEFDPYLFIRKLPPLDAVVPASRVALLPRQVPLLVWVPGLQFHVLANQPARGISNMLHTCSQTASASVALFVVCQIQSPWATATPDGRAVPSRRLQRQAGCTPVLRGACHAAQNPPAPRVS